MQLIFRILMQNADIKKASKISLPHLRCDWLDEPNSKFENLFFKRKVRKIWFYLIL